MTDQYNNIEGVRSKASIFGHPIHPMIIPFPIAFLVALFVTDMVFWSTEDRFWAFLSFWLALAGLVTGALAAVFGMIDFAGIRKARQYSAGWIHAGGNVVVMVLTIINLALRWQDPVEGVLPWGAALSGIVLALLIVTGWYGGELSYRFGIGVSPHHRRGERPMGA